MKQLKGENRQRYKESNVQLLRDRERERERGAGKGVREREKEREYLL